MSQPLSKPESQAKHAPLPAGFLRDPGHWLAFGFGSGCLRPAPGTWGTLAALPVYGLFASLAWPWYLLLLGLAFLLGVWLCDRAARELGVHDHSGIVWDEFVGLWITLAIGPASWLGVALGFVLFRFFDILKPWPIGWLDRRVQGGLGIMLDDVLAGVYALAVLALLMLWDKSL